MLSSSENAVQVWYVVLVSITIAVIVALLIRAFIRNSERPWPAIVAGLYNILLLILYLFGMRTQISWEGFGFLPLLALTLPWSRLIEWLFEYTGIYDLSFWGTGFVGTLLIYFITYYVLAGSVNSFIIYYLLKRRHRKVAEDEAWDQARRNR